MTEHETVSAGPESEEQDGIFAVLWRSSVPLLTLAVLFWSGNFIVGRAIAGIVPPVALAFWRWSIGLVLILAFGWRHIRRDMPRLVQAWPMLAVLAAFGIAGFNTLVYIGLKSTTALNALLLQSAMPLLILAFTFAIFRERPRIEQVSGVVISIAGVIAIAARGDLASLLGLTLNIGDVWVLAAIASYALYSALLRKRPQLHPLSFLAATFTLGSLMLLPLYVSEHLAGTQVQWGPSALLAIGYVAAFPGFLSYLLYNRGVELIGANAAGHFMHLMPVFGSALAILLLGERFAVYHAIGGGLIAAGLLVAMMGRRSG